VKQSIDSETERRMYDEIVNWSTVDTQTPNLATVVPSQMALQLIQEFALFIF